MVFGILAEGVPCSRCHEACEAGGAQYANDDLYQGTVVRAMDNDGNEFDVIRLCKPQAKLWRPHASDALPAWAPQFDADARTINADTRRVIPASVIVDARGVIVVVNASRGLIPALAPTLAPVIADIPADAGNGELRHCPLLTVPFTRIPRTNPNAKALFAVPRLCAGCVLSVATIVVDLALAAVTCSRDDQAW
jgi:hypothetical protein